MRLLFLDREIPKLFILLICLIFSEGKKHFKNNDDSSQESKSTFITIRLPANVATHNQDCMFEGVARHHGDAWSPGPCIPECRCRHGHVKCSKLECPDLNCDKPIKKKWKCCPECLPTMDNGTSCGVWSNGGNGNGGCCVFPFKYNDVMHYTCTYLDHSKPWCSISMDFDRDGVWGECIDDGDKLKALRFKQHKGEIQQQDNSTDAIVSNIANNVANSVSNGNANVTNEVVQNITNPNPVTPESNVTRPAGNESGVVSPESSAAAATVIAAGVQPTESFVIPAASSNATSAAASGSIQPSQTTPIQPQATGTIGIAAANASVLPSPSPSAGVPVVPQASGVVQPASNETVSAVATSVQVAASQSAQPAGQTVVVGAVPTPSLGVGASVAGATTPLLPGPAPQVTQQPAPQVTQQPAPQVTQQPAPQPTQQPQPTLQPAPQPVPQVTPQPAPQPPGQPLPQPTQQPGPQPAPAPGQPSVEGTTPGYPFPISQTTLTPGQTQAPGPAPGQAVHEVTTTEYNATHNISTTESWFGKPNETLNRTNEVANQADQLPGGAGTQQALANQIAGGNEAASSQTASDSYNNGQGNQAVYGYQAASSPYYYQNQAPYNDQQSNSQADYSTYNTQSNSQANNQYYNAESNSQASYPSYYTQNSPQADYPSYNTQAYSSYDSTASQQYGESQAQNTAGQASYYSNEQQYQQQYGADPGSYYTG